MCFTKYIFSVSKRFYINEFNLMADLPSEHEYDRHEIGIYCQFNEIVRLVDLSTNRHMCLTFGIDNMVHKLDGINLKNFRNIKAATL